MQRHRHRARMPQPLSKGEEAFALDMASRPVPAPVREFRFHDSRLWRFDFAWPDRFLAVELEGGTWSRGAHTRGRGFREDAEKYNTAALLGWRVLRFTTDQAISGEAGAMVGEFFEAVRRAAEIVGGAR